MRGLCGTYAGPVRLRELNGVRAALHLHPLPGWNAFAPEARARLWHALTRQRELAALSPVETAPSHLLH